MKSGSIALALLTALCCGCSPAKPSPPPASAAASAPKPPAPPPRMQTMICRNSQTGQSVACGSPNAVMVGMKEN